MHLTRRHLLLTPALLSAAPRPNSKFANVQIGAITYSFRALPGSAEQTLQYLTDCNISAIELMSNVPESFAGSPAASAPPIPGGRNATPEQVEARRKLNEAVRQWRLATPMTKFKEFRKMYEAAGVKIYAFKLPPTLDMPDAEYDYIWNVAETLGANHITMELPTDDKLLARVANFAAKRKLDIAFHTHGQGGSSGFDRVLNASNHTALNLDIGHYFGVTGESPVPIVEKYASRIKSLHLKDRKSPANGGTNMPWGQGETPIAATLKLMHDRKYKFPAAIEYEYQTPANSDVLTEIKKCVDFCRQALRNI